MGHENLLINEIINPGMLKFNNIQRKFAFVFFNVKLHLYKTIKPTNKLYHEIK